MVRRLTLVETGFSRRRARVPIGFAGTPGYLSPEVLKKEPYGKPVDIWACGKHFPAPMFTIFMFPSLSLRRYSLHPTRWLSAILGRRSASIVQSNQSGRLRCKHASRVTGCIPRRPALLFSIRHLNGTQSLLKPSV